MAAGARFNNFHLPIEGQAGCHERGRVWRAPPPLGPCLPHHSPLCAEQPMISQALAIRWPPRIPWTGDTTACSEHRRADEYYHRMRESELCAVQVL